MAALLILAVLTPILIVPLIAGILILRKAPARSFAHMLGVFALKPIAATPLMFMVAAAVGQRMRDLGALPTFLVLAAPGIMLTCGIVLIYRSSAWRDGWLLLLVLLLDSARWGSTTLAFALTSTLSRSTDGLQGLLGFAGIGMPTVFAIFAWLLAQSTLRRTPADAGAAV